MKRSPLQLEASWVDGLTVGPSTAAARDDDTAAPGDREATSNEADGLELAFDFHVLFHAEDRDLFRIVLRVDSTEGDSRCPYSLTIIMSGQFRIASSYDDPVKRSHLISNTAPSMLYGAVREQVLLLTSRCARGPWTLPAVMFPIRDDIQSDAVNDSAAPQNPAAKPGKSGKEKRSKEKKGKTAKA